MATNDYILNRTVFFAFRDSSVKTPILSTGLHVYYITPLGRLPVEKPATFQRKGYTGHGAVVKKISVKRHNQSGDDQQIFQRRG
jgi:hypothetical protein